MVRLITVLICGIATAALAADFDGRAFVKDVVAEIEQNATLSRRDKNDFILELGNIAGARMRGEFENPKHTDDLVRTVNCVRTKLALNHVIVARLEEFRTWANALQQEHNKARKFADANAKTRDGAEEATACKTA